MEYLKCINIKHKDDSVLKITMFSNHIYGAKQEKKLNMVKYNELCNSILSENNKLIFQKFFEGLYDILPDFYGSSDREISFITNYENFEEYINKNLDFLKCPDISIEVIGDGEKKKCLL